MPVRRSLVLVAMLALVGGCGLFASRDVPYQDSRSHPPLQIPEDLSQPVADETLRIPDVTPVSPASTGTAAAPGPGGSQLLTDRLVVADHPASAWRRIGLALERMAGEVEIVSRDGDGLRYEVVVTATRPASGFLRRLVRRDERVTERFELVLSGIAEGTEVRAVGGGTLAMRLLGELQRRLG